MNHNNDHLSSLRKLANYLKQKSEFPKYIFKILHNSGYKQIFPYKVIFELSALCNMKCTMCPRNVMRRKEGLIDFDVFKKIFSEINPPFVNLSGLGEPLLHPQVFEIIEYCKKNRTYVKIFTNGTLLNNENITKLLSTHIDEISISLDGVDKKTYEAIRIGADFDEVISNIKNLINIIRRLNSKTKVQFYLVLQKDNFRRFPDYIRFALSLGVDSVSGGVVGVGVQESPFDNGLNSYNDNEINNMIKELKKLQKETNIFLDIDDIIRYLRTRKERNGKTVPCYKPWYSAFVTWDGDVVPCCCCAVNKDYIIGNALTESFATLWRNEKSQAIRENAEIHRRDTCSWCRVDESHLKSVFKTTLFFYKLFLKKS